MDPGTLGKEQEGHFLNEEEGVFRVTHTASDARWRLRIVCIIRAPFATVRVSGSPFIAGENQSYLEHCGRHLGMQVKEQRKPQLCVHNNEYMQDWAGV